VGRALDRDMLRRGSGIAAEETHPVSDTRGSAVYKREMVKVLCRHALETAVERAGSRSRSGPPGAGRAGSPWMPWGRNEPEPAGTRCQTSRGHR